MQKIFLKELLTFLQERVKGQSHVINKDTSNLIPLLEKLTSFEKKKDLKSLEEFLSKYYKEQSSDTKGSLEACLLDCFQKKTPKKVKTFSKILRGLPRLYNRKTATLAKIDPHFSHLFFLKRRYLDKTLFFLYENIQIKEKVEVACVYETSEEKRQFSLLFETVKASLKSFDFRLVPLSTNKKDKKALQLSKEKKISKKSTSKELLTFLRSIPLIFQFFQMQPCVQDFIEGCDGIKPHVEVLGGYGQIEKPPFTPLSSFQSMGLYFLELGVMVPEKKTFIKEDLPFYLCASQNDTGALLYLLFLIELNKKHFNDLRVVFLDKDCLLSFSETLFARVQENKIQKIDILIDQKVFQSKKIASTGKNLQLVFDSNLIESGPEKLYAHSLEPVGIEKDYSFSYAISYEKAFFLSICEDLSFSKDLLAIAKNTLISNRKTLSYLEGMYQLQLHQTAIEEKEYVSEDYFQLPHLEKEEEILKRLTLLYQDPSAVSGVKSLCKIIQTSYSANGYLVGLLKRAYLHQKHPQLKEMEEKYIIDFLFGGSTFLEMVKSVSFGIKKILLDNKKCS